MGDEKVKNEPKESKKNRNIAQHHREREGTRTGEIKIKREEQSTKHLERPI